MEIVGRGGGEERIARGDMAQNNTRDGAAQRLFGKDVVARVSRGGLSIGKKRKTTETHTTRRIHPREPVTFRTILKPPILRRHPLRPPATTLTLRRTTLLVNDHAAPLALSQTAMFEFEFARDQVDGPSLGGSERAREGEFVAEGVGGEEEDARVQFEGRRVVHVEVVCG